MKYLRILSPAKEQAMLTIIELRKKYGRSWQSIIKTFRTEKIDTEHWYDRFKNKD
jgi:hypothetical protein